MAQGLLDKEVTQYKIHTPKIEIWTLIDEGPSFKDCAPNAFSADIKFKDRAHQFFADPNNLTI